MRKARREFLLGAMGLNGVLMFTPLLSRAEAKNYGVQSPIADTPKDVRVFGGTWDGEADVTVAAQAALDSGARVIDFKSLSGRVTQSLTIPAGVEARNVNLIAGVPGMKVLLVNSKTKINGAIRGTGGVENEWGVYPAGGGVEDVTLDLEISRVTVGIQVWGIGTGEAARRWTGVLRFKELTGGGSRSNGYGLLIPGGEECKFKVFSSNTPRHCVYLSDGAKNNEISLSSVGNGGAPVQLAAYHGQPYVEGNKITASVSGMRAMASASAYAVNLVGNVRDNIVEVNVENSPRALGGVLFRSLDKDTVAYRNSVILHYRGEYSGSGAVQSDSAYENTVEVYGDGYSSAGPGKSVVSVNDYNGIVKPNGEYSFALHIKKFVWNAQGRAMRGVGAYASYAPVDIGDRVLDGFTNYTSDTVSVSGRGRVVGFSSRK